MPKLAAGSAWAVVDLPEGGGPASTFAEHLYSRYQSLAGFTVFTTVTLSHSLTVT